MKKTTIMYECDNETHNSTVRAEGELLELIAGAGAILRDVSKMAAKALGEEPADMAIHVCKAVVDMLKDDEKGEDNE